ncbi:trimeric intracellular cation channel family protein [Phenylobacterium montanum]|uniref:Trimeric intracellular cation channel family protein n=2 Tax=Phenylobacterium montanum TaxID=2823693 RepID=A0A975G535_9CAUL|nr:trimeric intracellular cation channel family protein [Caulobacter sp. S6]
MPALEWMNYIGIAVFAASGALVAADRRQTLLTFAFFAVATAVGGGTVRDLLIAAPVFWIRENATLLICFSMALAVWLTPARFWGGRALVWLDAVGLAAYAAYGAAKALAFGVVPVPAFALGVLTACLGGIVRDVLAGEPSILMKPELYVTAAALSSGVMVFLSLAGAPSWIAATSAAALGFALRAGALVWRWGLPTYRT